VVIPALKTATEHAIAVQNVGTGLLRSVSRISYTGAVRRLVDKGRTWVKLSVTYDSSKIGPPSYADVNKVGAAYVQAAPERMLWGSNWPHPREATKPDDAMLFDLLAVWAPSEATRHRILVENPQALYGFSKVS
jgi:D-galactarolactone isomerase